MSLRLAFPTECAALTALCLRSKAHWGYDAAFMAACVAPLTVRPEDLADIRVWDRGGTAVGIVQLGRAPQVEIGKLFVTPEAMGLGIGRRLADWAIREARTMGAARITVEADPQAVPFYARLGFSQVGAVPSEAIAGRMLPLLALPLDD